MDAIEFSASVCKVLVQSEWQAPLENHLAKLRNAQIERKRKRKREGWIWKNEVER